MNSSPPDPLFLRPVDAAELARVSTRAIYRAIQRGELRAVRLCSRLRIPREAFDEWVERCTVQPPRGAVVEFPPAPPPIPGSFRGLLARSHEGRG
jgi:excisionase family DNA binding protein